jgi:hypothetical protein
MSHPDNTAAPENPAAFPYNPGWQIPSTGLQPFGMTLRDWFAGQIVGHITHADLLSNESSVGPGHVAAASYALADAMLAERAKVRP